MEQDLSPALGKEGFAAFKQASPDVARPLTTAPGTIRFVPEADLERAIGRARTALCDEQRPAGDWCYDLQADCTIPAEYILMMHFLDEIDPALQGRLAVGLRRHQADHGGWPLYHGGELDVSCTVKCYWALKLAGDDIDAPHMKRAREAILARGGAARANVFTRLALAMFGQIPWRGVPWVPAEIILLPRWFPFHLGKVSYWSRTVMVPLSVLYTLRARAKNPTGRDIRELFTTPPEEERRYFPIRNRMNRLILGIERTLRLFEGLIPKAIRRRALRTATDWFIARLNGSDGLGGIFPAMVNAYEALRLMGYPADHQYSQQCRDAIRGLLVECGDWAWCQPCVSPVWDTGIAALAINEARSATTPDARANRALEAGLDWLVTKQVLDGPADWRDYRPDLAPGGWAFQYNNAYYPDLDDTAMVAWAMHETDPVRYAPALDRAVAWLIGMQSHNGGFGAFDADNTHDWLNDIPFADHGALLDPPTADVTGRVVAILSRRNRPDEQAAMMRALDYLYAEQESFGGWFGRWGTNYIYGTWSVITGLELVDDPRKHEAVRRAVKWLLSVQRSDGSWGESNDSYARKDEAGTGTEGTSFSTSWALLALMSAGVGDAPEVRRGVAWLLRHQRENGLWNEDLFNAPGFPRVFYLRYHGYSRHFPLWALARYRTLQRAARS